MNSTSENVCIGLASLACQQCDQIIFQSLAICNKLKFAQLCHKFAKVGSAFCRKEINCQKFAEDFKLLPKCQNFAKSGHTAWQAIVKQSFVHRRASNGNFNGSSWRSGLHGVLAFLAFWPSWCSGFPGVLRYQKPKGIEVNVINIL